MPVDDSLTPPDSAPANDTVASVELQNSEQNQDVTANPSPAKDESLLDRVKAAIKPKTEGSSPSQDSQDPSQKTDAAPEGEEAEPEGDPTEGELSRYHSKTRKRITKLMERAKAAETEVETLRPDAEVGRNIVSYIAESGMTSDEANLLLEVGRNMKRDPLKAWEQLQPYVRALSQMAGEALPTDLQQAVADGKIAPEYAKQLARSRTQAQVQTHRATEADQRLQQRTAAETTERHAANVGQAISTWEANQARNDPDWKLKSDRIAELIELEVRRSGYFKTTADAVAAAEKALARVNAETSRFKPRPVAVTNVNPTSAARAQPAKPTSAIEAARLALASSA